MGVNPSTRPTASRTVGDVDTSDDRAHTDAMTDDEKRTDQLTRAPKSDPEDDDPRITTTQLGNVTRIDVADTAVVRPGNPEKQHGDSLES